MCDHPHPAYPNLVARLEQIAEAGANRRESAIDSVAAVMAFFREIGMERRLYGPLLDLVGALVDAREGRSNLLLTPATYKGGTSKKRIREQYDLVASAAHVTAFHQDVKLSLKDAAKKVEKLTGIPAAKILEFRKNLGKGRISDKEAINDYRFILTKIREQPLPAEQRIERSLRVIAEMRPPKKG